MTKTKHYKRIDLNTTRQIESGGILGRLTGKNDLIFLRNKWQTELDNSWAALMNMAHYIEESNDSNQTICTLNQRNELKQKIKSIEEERDSVYSKMFTCIQQDKDYSEKMWRIHQEMHTSSPKTAGNYSTSLDNINVTNEAIRKYVERYPKVEFKNDIQYIKDKESEIKRAKTLYHQNISLLRDYFEQFKLELLKLESKYNAYLQVYEEGKRHIESCKFNQSFLYGLMTAEQKQTLRLDTTTHRLLQVENTTEHYRALKAKVEKALENEM
ncbi:MAG: hypothetical protein ACYDEF_08570 [Methanosarcina sp.]